MTSPFLSLPSLPAEDVVGHSPQKVFQISTIPCHKLTAEVTETQHPHPLLVAKTIRAAISGFELEPLGASSSVLELQGSNSSPDSWMIVANDVLEPEK